MFKKLIISLVLASVLLVSFIPYAQAQVGTWYHPTFGEYVTKVYDQTNPDEIFGERYTQAQVIWILHALRAAMMPDEVLLCFGASITSPQTISACLAGVSTLLIQTFGIGYTGDMNLAQVVDYTLSKNQLSGVGYIQSKLSNLHLIPEAKAQGYGFSTLSPIQNIWKAIRNVSYFLLVIAFVVIGFMVMFRVRISPQTVITIQSAIPRMIFVLLLITFSYAIAGFVIDLAFVTIGLLAVAADSVSSLNTIQLYTALISGHPIWSMFLIIVIYFLGATVMTGGIPIIGGLLGSFMVLIDIVVSIIVAVVLFIIFLRMLWVWVRALINIVLLTVFGPIIILGGVFPNSGGFGSWLRDIAAQVAVFPGVIAMFFIAHFVFWSSINVQNPNLIEQVFIGLNSVGTLNPYGFQPVGTSGTIHLPGFSLGTGGTFGVVVAFGILALVPSIATIIQSVISRRPFGYGTAIGAAVMAGAAPILYPAREIGGIYGSATRKSLEHVVGERFVPFWSRLKQGGGGP